MPILFTEYYQLTTQKPPYVFEADLAELTRSLRHPLPEIKGGMIHPGQNREQAWLVVCTLRGPVVPPLMDELTVEVIERSWVDGIVRVMQQAIARLVHHHRDTLGGTPYEFYGRRDAEGHPRDAPHHPVFQRHLPDMEYLLARTQTYLDRARISCDTKAMALERVEDELNISEEFRRRLTRRKKALRSANAFLRSQLEDLQTRLAEAEARIEELEESDSMSTDDDDLPSEDQAEDMDVEPESEQDDDDHAVDPAEQGPEEAFLEEEDPEEPPFEEEEGSATPVAAVTVE